MFSLGTKPLVPGLAKKKLVVDFVGVGHFYYVGILISLVTLENDDSHQCLSHVQYSAYNSCIGVLVLKHCSNCCLCSALFWSLESKGLPCLIKAWQPLAFDESLLLVQTNPHGPGVPVR